MIRFPRCAHRLRQPLARLALLVVVLGSLLPVFASLASAAGVGGASGAGFWLEICAPSGIERVFVGAADEDSDEISGQASVCHWCRLTTDPVALPPPAGRLLAVVVVSLPDRLLPVVDELFRPGDGWLPARPRGPPASG